MTVFLARPASHRLGHPVQAEGCRCEHPLFQVQDDPATCARCGRLPVTDIREQWAVETRRERNRRRAARRAAA